MSASNPGIAVQYALVRIDTGAVVEVLDGAASHPRTEGLALALSELLRSGPSPDWPLLFSRLGRTDLTNSFREVIVMSQEHVFIIEPLSDRPNVALVAVSLELGNLGEALSGIRERLARMRAA